MTSRPAAAAPGAVQLGLAERPRTPWPLLGGGAALVALVCSVTAAQVSVLASLDETVYKLAGANFADGFPGTLVSDSVSRGAARLYSLVLTPLFVLLDGDQAVRAGRALNGVMWAATAVPVYFLARRAIASPRAAVAAALLSVAVPWATVSLILFSEALSYLLFACTVLAMLRALEAPSARRDALAIGLMLALITARMQFAVVPVAWVAVVVGFELRRGARRDLRSALRRYPVTFALVGLAALAVLYLVVSGELRGQLNRFGGPYSALQDRTTLPRDAGVAVLVQAGLLALGVGLVAGVVAMAWLGRALRGREGEPALRLAVLGAAVIGLLFASTVWAQGGFLDDHTEERYYIYAVPFLWIAAVAALRSADLTAGRVLWGGVVLAGLLFLVPITVPITGEQMFLGPVSGVVADATPRVDNALRDLLAVDAAITRRDLAGWFALIVAVAAALLWRRRRGAALVLAAVVQLGLVLYAFAAVHGRMEPIPGVLTGQSFDALAWVDRAVPGGADVVMAENSGTSRDVDVLHSVFWNDAIRSRLAVTDPAYQPPYPAILLPRHHGEPDAGGRLPRPPSAKLVVTQRDAPHWQLEGREVAAEGRLALLDTGATGTLTWVAAGLEADRQVVRGIALTARGGYRYAIAFEPAAAGATGRVRVRLGDVSRLVTAGPEAGRQVVGVDLCDERGAVTGTFDLVEAATPVGSGRYSAAQVPSVRVERC